MQDPHEQLHRTKLTLLAVILLICGLTLMIATKTLGDQSGWTWLSDFAALEVGSTLFVAGLFSVALDYFDGKDREARDTARLQRTLRSEAPAIRDAVIRGFAFEPDDLTRVATPEVLDQIIQNSLAIRLGDKAFAEEVYTDIRDQAIRAEERWYDAQVKVRLSPLSMDRGSGVAAPSVGAVEAHDEKLYLVTVRWEYSVVPRHPIRRFVVVSSKEEYRELTRESGATSTWFMRPKDQISVGSREAFELMQFTLDGEDQHIQRSARRGGQTYAVSIPTELADREQPVAVSYTFQTVVSASSHVLNIDLEQPTRGIRVEFDYSDTTIDHVSVIDSIASSRQARIVRAPAGTAERSVTLEFDGWVFPRSGAAFVWSGKRDDQD